MIHIVFNESDISVLTQAIALDQTLVGDILLIHDDFAVGRLFDHGDEGERKRKAWWTKLMEIGQDYNAERVVPMVQDEATVSSVKARLAEGEIVWIWAAQNQHDVCGYYWLISQLAEFQGLVFILYLNNLPFINEQGGIFYPAWLHKIPPREFLKAKKLARPVTPSEFEIDTDEYKKFVSEQKMVRRLEGGKKIAGFDADYFDANLARYVTGDFSKASKIIQQFLSKEKEITGDVFVAWRLKALVETQGWEVKGDMTKSSKDFELRNPSIPSLKRKPNENEPTTEVEK